MKRVNEASKTMGWEERAADRVLDELQIVDLADLRLLDAIAYERGATVCDRPMRGAEARLTVVGRRAIIALSPDITNPQRRRFAVAHELGHLEMHRDVTSLSLCKEGDLEILSVGQTSGTREQEANGFAAALLMPRRFFSPLCKDSVPSLELVEDLARKFDTSILATGLRYAEHSDEAIAFVVSQSGLVTWYRRSQEFERLDLFVETKCRLARGSRAYDIHQTGTRVRKPAHVRADLWLTKGKYGRDATLVEQSWLLSGGTIATLLWVDDDIESDQFYWEEN